MNRFEVIMTVVYFVITISLLIYSFKDFIDREKKDRKEEECDYGSIHSKGEERDKRCF